MSSIFFNKPIFGGELKKSIAAVMVLRESLAIKDRVPFFRNAITPGATKNSALRRRAPIGKKFSQMNEFLKHLVLFFN